MSAEDRLLADRLTDLADMCERQNIPKFSSFLDEREVRLAKSVLNGIGFYACAFFGGYEGAERQMVGLFPDYIQPDEYVFPIKIIEFSYRVQDKLTHRDFLGAVMSCRVKREVTGDIIVGEGRAQLFVTEGMCDFLISEISTVGSVGVKLSAVEEFMGISEQRMQEISGTVASLRIDALLSLSAKISREKASAMIKSEGVDINHEKCFSPDKLISPGDRFSVRGIGKFILREVGGETRKNRIFVHIGKYI